MKRLWGLVVLLAIVGCQSEVQTSGVENVDQTAVFLKHHVDRLKRTGSFDKADAIAQYLTSAMGKAEYWPPHPEWEGDASEGFTGPRPGEGVGVWASPWETSAFSHYILVSADSERNVVVLRAFVMGEDEPFHRWEVSAS